MTLPDPAPVRKPPSRFWLFAPFVVLALAAAGWGVGWNAIGGQALKAMDQQAARLRAEGWQVSWSHRRLSGWPFRFELDLADAHMVEPSGRGVSTPLLRAEAYVYDPGKWVAFAPTSLTLERPGGPVKVEGRVLRAGLTGIGSGLLNLTLEGRDLSFTPAPGAAAFALAGAGRIIASLRQGPDDQGALLIDAGALTTGGQGLLGQVSDGKPADLSLELILSHRSAISGADWPSAWRAWAAAGGSAKVQNAKVAAANATLTGAEGGELGVGADGRLTGRIPIDPAASSGAGAYAGLLGDPALSFQNGQAMIGAAPVAPAPSLF